MNATRRKLVEKAIGTLEQLIADIEAIRDEEQDAYDNLPESVQSGERGEKIQACAESLSNACDDLENAKSSLAYSIGD